MTLCKGLLVCENSHVSFLVRKTDPGLSAWITEAKLYNQSSVMTGVSAVQLNSSFCYLVKIWNLLMRIKQINLIYSEYPTAFKLYWVRGAQAISGILYPSIPTSWPIAWLREDLPAMLLLFSSVSLWVAVTVIYLFPNTSDSYCTLLTGLSTGARMRLCLIPGSRSQIHLLL